MEPLFPAKETIKQFIPITWKVEKGDWCINFIWFYLDRLGKLEWFNDLSGDDQYAWLVSEFGEE